MDGKLFSNCSCCFREILLLFCFLHTLTTTLRCMFPFSLIFRLAMWAASGLILQGCTNHMGGVEAITQSLNDNMF